jgi:dipeptidyl aminopeptidase/acylaminoacyl peptidase
MKIAVNILIGIILIVVALSFVLVYANTHPPRYPLHIPPSEFKADYEGVSFMTGDGVDLKGWLIKPPHPRPKMPAIIICHGIGANKSDFTDLAVTLSRRGYYVLTFDFRAHGESGGRRSSLGYHEQKDIAAALGFLTSRQENDPKRIGIYGFSMGGAAAILAAGHSDGFSAVVADSAFSSLKDMARAAVTGFYRLPAFPFLQLTTIGYELYFQTGVEAVSPVTAVGKISPVPVLIIAGDGDRLIPAENGRKLYEAAREPKELWIIPGAGHGATLAAAGREYEKRVGEFFDRNLKSGGRGNGIR